MFNIGWTEFLLIAIVFLIFVKPKDFPFFFRKVSTIFYKIKNYITKISDEFNEKYYFDEFKKKNREILQIEKELKKLKKRK